MKRMWVALVLLILAVTVCGIGIYNTQKVTAEMIQTVSQAKSAQEKGDDKAACKLSEKAEDDWREAHSVLCTYMVHARLEEIDQTLSTLPELCRNGAKDAFLSECDRSLTQFSYLTEAEMPSIGNIF